MLHAFSELMKAQSRKELGLNGYQSACAKDVIKYALKKKPDLSTRTNSTFELGCFQKFLPLRADLLHATRHLRGGIMLSVQQLLPRLLEGINAALIG